MTNRNRAPLFPQHMAFRASAQEKGVSDHPRGDLLFGVESPIRGEWVPLSHTHDPSSVVLCYTPYPIFILYYALPHIPSPLATR